MFQLSVPVAETAIAATRDPVSQGIVAIVIALVFVVLAVDTVHRVLVILCAVALLWLITYLTPFHLITFEGATEAIDFNVILLLASMMALVGVLKSTRVFSWAVARVLRVAGGRPLVLQALLLWFTGIVSSVADNVTTVIFTTPMALEVAAATGVRAIAFLLPMVMAANIGGTATLIGDPPNILIGSGAGLSFLDFVVNLTAPVLVMMVVLEWLSARAYRGELGAAAGRSAAPIDVPALENLPLLRWTLGISALVFIGFFTHTLTGMPVAVPAAIGAAAILLVQDRLHSRARSATPGERMHGVLDAIENEIEWPTLSFFALLFIAVGAAVQTGLIDTLAAGLSGLVTWGGVTLGLDQRGTLLFAALLVLWMSGVLSALIDNIPYVAVTIPIVATLAAGLAGNTEVLWWALSLGACLGGNGTMIGASANVTVVGLAERTGLHISFGQFTRFGARIAVTTLLVSTVFLTGFVYAGPTLTHLGSLGFLVLLTGFRAVSLARAGEPSPR